MSYGNLTLRTLRGLMMMILTILHLLSLCPTGPMVPMETSLTDLRTSEEGTIAGESFLEETREMPEGLTILGDLGLKMQILRTIFKSSGCQQSNA